MATVATSTAQMSPSPNFAPASPAVATVPASRNPPVAVTIPSVIENHFFIDHQPLRTHYSHDSKPQPEHANHRTHSNMEHRPLVWPAYRDSTGALQYAYQEPLARRAMSGQGHQAHFGSSQS